MSELHTLRQRIREALRQTEYAEWAEAAAESVTPAIYLLAEEADDDTLPIGSSKIGGAPDLARPWPMQDGKPLYFLAQFNLQELTAYDEDGLLPGEGLLSFFLGIEHLT